jgi:D-aspartate ligase
MSEKTPVLLLGLYYSSINIAHSLGRRGIKVYGIDMLDDSVGAYSRYVERIEAPRGGEELKDFLIGFSERLGERIVLMPLADYYLLFFNDYLHDLAGRYIFCAPDQDVLSKLLSKTQSSDILSRHGIAHPKSLTVEKNAPSPPNPDDINCPCILKPMYKHNWQTNRTAAEYVGEGRQVLYVEHRQMLREAMTILIPIADLIIQEFVPGSSESRFYYFGYRDSGGRIVTSYVGNKIRTVPDGLGSETLLRSVHNAALLNYGDEILGRLDYRGPAGIDFKYDERDDSYKVIEINCRVGINDCYMIKYGIDLPYIYYLDSQDIEVEPIRKYPEGVTWYDPFRDLEWMRLYGRERNIGWGPWLRGLFGYDTYAILERSDLRPFVKSIVSLFAKGLRKFIPFHRMHRPSTRPGR